MGRRTDPFWAHAEKVDGCLKFKCIYCKRDFAGGASRIKAHLAGVSGHDIVACNAVPLDVQKQAQATQKKREAQATQGTNKKLKIASTSASKLKTKGKEEYMAEIVLNDVVDRLITNIFSLRDWLVSSGQLSPDTVGYGHVSKIGHMSTSQCVQWPSSTFSLIGTENIGFELSFRMELQNLLETLFKIKFLLDDAQKRQSSDECVRIWLMELRDVVYGADNVLDEFSYKSFWQKVQTQNQMVDQVHSFSFCNPDKVRTIKQLLDKIVHDVVGFHPRMELVNSIHKISLDMNIDPLLDDSEVIGREYDVIKIVNILISSSNQQVISILPIVGMAGLGKTTLAKLVYNNETIKKHFDVLAWVNVGKHFNVEVILRKILISHEEIDLSDLKNDEILQICVEELRAIKYLLILDDVQDEDLEKWDTLKGFLSKFNSSTGNNIVVTTRSDNMAEIMATHHKHQLEKLSKDDCWSIFKKRIFTNGRIPLPLDLEAIGREIAKRCGRVPLVARVLGGIMCFEFDKNKWLEVQNNKIWDLLDEDSSGIFPVLKLCFDYLPTPSLKRCFAYCAIFPKDYDMKKDEVIQYWMAEGFLELAKEANMVMENIGNMYFNILLATSFFQNARKDAYGNIISYKMHDLVHDFALLISKSETLILEGDLVDDVSKVQPLFVRSNGETTPRTSFCGDSFIKMRTLISENLDFDDMLSNFKCLRVLKLSGHSIIGLPNSIEQLIHLRLLHILHTKIEELPKSITKLYHLQTLRIEACPNLMKLPEDLSNLINLRHICINTGILTMFWYKDCLLKNMGRLTCLQTLNSFGVDRDEGYRINEIGPLKNLREINIYNLEKVTNEEEAKSAKLNEKEILKLGLYWEYKYSIAMDRYDKDEKVLEGLHPHPNLKRLTIEGYGGKKFPSWVNDLSLFHNLIHIKLNFCLECEEVPTLGQLPCLRVLEINHMYKVRSIGSKFYNCDGSYRNTTTLFPALRILKLEWMSSLEEWKDAKELTSAGEVLLVFPCLEELIIRLCPKLRSLPGVPSVIQHLEIIGCGIDKLPSGLQFCTSLQYLKIKGCRNLKSNPESLHTCVSLQNFVVEDCPELSSLPGVPLVIQHLEIIGCGIDELSSVFHSLIELKISNCPDVILKLSRREGRLKTLVIGGFEELDAFPILHYPSIRYSHASLKKLILFGRRTLNSLPNEIQLFTALEELRIQNFNGMEALPDWLSCLSSLQKLLLYHCKKLMYLPILHLTNLKHLRIDDCRNLEKICAEGSGVEWFQIAHVPNIRINGKYIKGKGDSYDYDEAFDWGCFDVLDSDSEDEWHMQLRQCAYCFQLAEQLIIIAS